MNVRRLASRRSQVSGSSYRYHTSLVRARSRNAGRRSSRKRIRMLLDVRE